MNNVKLTGVSETNHYPKPPEGGYWATMRIEKAIDIAASKE
jgi:hypothetical protein